MRRAIAIGLCISLAAAAAAGEPRPFGAQTPAPPLDAIPARARPERLLEEAFLLETARCDPRAAAAAYRALLAEPGLPFRIAALAHLRLGICLHLQEDWPSAEKELRTVVERFPGEADAVRTARRYLGEAPRDPARFMPPGVILYVEMADLSDQAEYLSDLIRGTPLENPVDAYLLARSAPSAEGPPQTSGTQSAASAQVEELRAVLNLNVLKELRKIEGIAIGASSLEKERPAWLLVLLPGTSDLFRVIIKTMLSAAIDLSAPEILGALRIFRLKKDNLHVAMDEKEEIFLIGSSRDMVTEAILRGMAQETGAPGSGTGAAAAPRALSDVDDFRRAKAARAGSMLFMYSDRENAMAALRSQTPEKDRPSFDEARRLLGLDHLRALASTLARSGDDLRLTLRARVDPERHPIWPLFRTPPLGAACFPFIPAGSPAFIATAIVDGESRWKAFRGALRPLLAGLPDEFPVRVLRNILTFLDGLEMDFGRDFLGELRSAALGMAPRLSFPAELSYFLILEFRDGDVAAARAEGLSLAISRRVTGREPARSFQDEPSRGGIVLRSFEAVPGFRVLYAREGSTFVFSPLASVALGTVEARRTGASAARSLVPPLASKLLALRPQALRDLGASRPPQEFSEAFVSHLDQVLFFSEEAPDGFAFELRIPDATQAIRETLKEMRRWISGGSPGAGSLPQEKPTGK